jgi:hypothetical protein
MRSTPITTAPALRAITARASALRARAGALLTPAPRQPGRLNLALGLLGALALAGCGGSAHHTATSKTASKLPLQARIVVASDRSAAVGHLVSAHTTGNIVASIPFNPQSDGFSFENYGFIAGSPEIDPHVLREMFGDGVCATAPSDSCTLVPSAQQFADEVDNSSLGGHCFGFSVTALRFFTRRLSPTQFGGSTTYSLSLSSDLSNEIAYGFAMQALRSVTSQILSGSPSDVIADLEKAFANPSAEVYTLAIRNGTGPGSDGHAVTPFGIEDLGGGKFNILIYDNNKPGTTQAMLVDTNAETWSYNLSTNPNNPSSEWSGQGTSNPMMLYPLFPGLGKQPCPFCTSAGAAGMVQVSLGGDPDTHGHLLINSGGRRLGFVNGKLINQIPGARVILPILNEDWNAHPEPIYEVPAGTPLSVTLQASGATGSEPASVHLVGPGFGATVGNLSAGAASSEQIEVSPGGSSISLKTLGTAGYQPPTVQLARDHGRGGDVVSLTPKALAPGTKLSLSLAAASGRVSVTSSAATPPVALTLQAVGRNGTKTTQNGNVALTPGRQAHLSLGLSPTA